ncbi:MAG TPA: hypothetical protein VIT91_20845 [Chthoniobacterales bacterium]
MRFLVAFFLLALASSASALTDSELDSIGRRVWQNECGGTRDGLTSWNSGENFASLGIGHFIWYPKGVDGPFEESFPKLVAYFQKNGVRTPQWLGGDCPWTTRAQFQAAFRGDRLSELRSLLASNIRLQSRFLALRMRDALPQMLAAAPASQRENIRLQFQRLTVTGNGTFALIDYVNFKGEGIKSTERYKGEGWGLLQVLAGMTGSGAGATKEFSASAVRVLTRRVENSPPSRGESRWLPGWKNRARAYTD